MVPLAAMLVAGSVLSACGTGGSSAAHDPLAKLDSAIGKLNDTRRIVVGDLDVLSTAVQSADAADRAAAKGDITDATALVPEATTLTAAAAPIAARGRSDVISYQQAIGEITGAIAKLGPTDGLTDDRSDALEAVGRTGNAEALAVTDSVKAYASSWPTYSTVTEAQHSWLQRAQRGEYSDAKVAGAAYLSARQSSATAFFADGAAIATAERTRVAATKAMAVALAQAQDTLAALPLPSLVPTPSPPAMPTSTPPSASGA